MNYTLESITEHAKKPAEFIAACEKQYEDKILSCAKELADKSETAPIILLAGPSGSGKTTSALKLRHAILHMGHECQVVSMDDYYKTVDLETHPRNEKGDIDFESPLCLDIPLFIEHICRLHDGKAVKIPHFDFPNQRRHPDMYTELTIPKGGMCIFEGIHALNPMFSEGLETFTQKVYVSARANIRDNGSTTFKGTWVRFLRRMIRDNNFRGWKPERTMAAWAMVRAGEKKYISPYKDLARYQIDTHMHYEVSMLRDIALPLLKDVPPGINREEEIKSIYPALERFPAISIKMLPGHSLLREFLG